MIGFADETYIDVSSGNGGPGAVSFRREKYVPKGGPDGGDGGRGGDVYFIVRKNLKTLAHLKLQRTFRAGNGEPGKGSRKSGSDGADIEISVPPGTLLKDPQTGELIKDLTGIDRWLFLKGGRGGKGNSHFATAVRRTPRFAQPGETGQTVRVHVELNIIADFGLVGKPNAGKSTLISVLTNARPKIADYPFTTKIPHLGVMKYHETEAVIADIPGIIEGASKGAGMGIKFLKHISRTKGILYCIDLSEDTFDTTLPLLRTELSEYLPELVEKPRIIVGTKLDIAGTDERCAKLVEILPGETVLGISAVTGQGVEKLRQAIVSLLNPGLEP